MTQSQSLPGPVSKPELPGCTPEEFDRYRGTWLAFSADGTRIIANSSTLVDLDSRVRAAGEDPEQVLIERIPGTDCIHSGIELS